MLALRGVYEKGKIELLDPPPNDTRSLVAVVFWMRGLIKSPMLKKRCYWRVPQPSNA
jgi:hypothetical protein